MAIRKIPYDPVNNRESYDLAGEGVIKPVAQVRYSWPLRKNFPLFPLTFYDVRRNDRCWFRHVNYPWLALELVLDGAMEYSEGNRRRVAAAGMLYVIVRGGSVRMVNADRNGRERRKLTLVVAGNCLSAIAEGLGFFQNTLLRLADPAAAEAAMRRIGAIIAASGSAVEASQLTYEFLLRLAGENPAPGLPDDLLRALDWLKLNFAGGVTIGEVAAAAGISEATLRRRFAEHLALSPLAYLNSLRMHDAATRLAETRLLVKEIALGCGFASALRFSAAFKRYFKQTPGAYREASSRCQDPSLSS